MSRLNRLFAVATAIALLILVTVWMRRPSYAGKSIGYWFPRLTMYDSWGNPSRSDRLRDLAHDAGPDVMPLLVAAANFRDGPAVTAYRRLKEWMPQPIADRMPSWNHDWEIGDDVISLLGKLRQPEVLRAFTNAFQEFPSYVQVHSIAQMRHLSNNEEILVPHLLRLLHSTDQDVVQVAGHSLMSLPGWRGEGFAELLAEFERIPDEVWSTSLLTMQVTTDIAERGTNGAAAEAWMIRWLGSPIPQLRAQAAVTLPAIAPERYPLKDTFMGQFPQLGRAEIFWALSPQLMRKYGLIPRPVRNNKALIPPALALKTGLTNYWPVPDNLRGHTNLVWVEHTTSRTRSACRQPTGSRPDEPVIVPEVSLADLARAALLHIENE